MSHPLAENSIAPSRARWPRPRWWWLVVAVGCLVLFVAVVRLVDTTPKAVPRVTLVNNSNYDIAASVTGATRDGEMELGTAKAHSSTDFNEVIDQGSTWVFHFSGLGGDAGEFTIARSDLARAQWRIQVPDAVVRHIAAADAATSPTTPSGH